MDRWAWVVITVAVMLVVYFLLGRAKRLPVAVICPHCGSLLPPKRRAALTHPASGVAQLSELLRSTGHET